MEDHPLQILGLVEPSTLILIDSYRGLEEALIRQLEELKSQGKMPINKLSEKL